MKKFFVSLVMLLSLSAACVFAQSSLIATLSHEGEITPFYGANALKEAHEAAVHGDAITLSSGTFTAVNINKALIIRGAGMQVEAVANTLPTVISGDFSINIPDSVTQRLTMEGLFNSHVVTVSNTLNEARFLKCTFKNFGYSSEATTKMKSLTFIHCRVYEELKLSNESSVTCVNCYIRNPKSFSETSSNFVFSNCVIRFQSVALCDQVYTSSFLNCIIYDDTRMYHTQHLDPSNTAYYCLGKSFENQLFGGSMPNATNTILIAELNTVFKTFLGSYDDNETFELTDAAKVQYLGSDKTEVGIYGGNFPYDPTTTNPQITKCNVAAKSTADGKLSVDIEVAGVE